MRGIPSGWKINWLGDECRPLLGQSRAGTLLSGPKSRRILDIHESWGQIGRIICFSCEVGEGKGALADIVAMVTGRTQILAPRLNKMKDGVAEFGVTWADLVRIDPAGSAYGLGDLGNSTEHPRPITHVFRRVACMPNNCVERCLKHKQGTGPFFIQVWDAFLAIDCQENAD